MGKFVLNADDFGLNTYHNKAVLNGYKNGVLSSASLMVNAEGFSEAVCNIISNCPDLDIGLHLNIMEGKALTDCFMLTDKNGNFNKGYLYLILKQYDKTLKKQIETEFRAQIEKAIQSGIKINRLDSHVHTHAIPEIFNITCKIAKEYNIEHVRTQSEKPYIVFPQCIDNKFPVNLVKVALLNFFTAINKRTLAGYNLKTNDNIIGVCYTGMMDSKTVMAGIKQYKNKTVEILIHPSEEGDSANSSRYMEFQITQDESIMKALRY